MNTFTFGLWKTRILNGRIKKTKTKTKITLSPGIYIVIHKIQGYGLRQKTEKYTREKIIEI